MSYNLDMDFDEHRRSMIGARRRNNIFGEVTDYILMPFLAKGGDGAIYNPAESDTNPISIYARSEQCLYYIKVLYHNSSTESQPVATPELKAKLDTLAKEHGATPIIAIARVYSKHVKFYSLIGSKITNFR